MNSVATRAAVSAPVRTQRAGRRARRAGTVAPWVFTAPSILVSLLVLIAPIVYTIYLSVQKAKITGGLIGKKELAFVGLDNFAAVLSDPAFWASIQRMLLYGVIYAPVMMGLAILFALLIDGLNSRFSRFARLAIFLPFAIPGVVASIMWGFLYLPGVSPAGEVFQGVGLPAPDFFGSGLLYFALANIGIWGVVGFNTVLLYTALRTIPNELLDAARVDGCTELQIALKVKLPMAFPAIVLSTIFALIGTLQVFTEPQLLRPLTTSISSDFMPMMNIYNQAFLQSDLNGAAASSLVLAALTLIGSLGVIALSRRRLGGNP